MDRDRQHHARQGAHVPQGAGEDALRRAPPEVLGVRLRSRRQPMGLLPELWRKGGGVDGPEEGRRQGERQPPQGRGRCRENQERRHPSARQGHRGEPVDEHGDRREAPPVSYTHLKTTLACAAARICLDRGMSVRFAVSTSLLESLREFGKDARSLADDLAGCDLLVIDDLGKEGAGTPRAAEQMCIRDRRGDFSHPSAMALARWSSIRASISRYTAATRSPASSICSGDSTRSPDRARRPGRARPQGPRPRRSCASRAGTCA